MATISILGLYNWDPTIFDDMVMPSYTDKEGTEFKLDRDTMIDSILIELGELETLFPNAEKMKEIIGIWSRRREPSWSRMYRVLIEDYDPFINIKRDELREIKQERDLAGTYSGKVNGWNSSTAVDRDSSDTTDKGTVTTTEHFHVEGDSAITDAQDVLKKEMEIRKTYNMYEVIIEEFKRRFCLMVY